MFRKLPVCLLIITMLFGGLPLAAQDATPTVRDYMNRGITNIQNGDYRSAVEDFSEAIKVDPTFADAYVARGYTYFILEEYELALADYDRALELDPDYVDAYLGRGDLYLRLGDSALAIVNYDRAIELDANNASAYFGRGNAYFEQENFQQAAADFTRVIELNPEVPFPYVARGYAYYNFGDAQRALDDLREYVRLAGDNADPQIVNLIAELESQTGPTPAGGGARAGAVSLAPLLASPTAQATEAIIDAEDILGADEATPAAPADEAVVYYNQGIAQVTERNFEEAIENFTRAIELDPNFADAYFSRGYAYWQQLEVERAIADYDEAIRLDPSVAQYFYFRGLVYYDLDVEQAIADFSAAIELEADFADAYFYRGILRAGQGDNERAIADYNRVIELAPQFAPAYYSRGLAYFNQGDNENAIADLSQALELPGGYADSAQVYSIRGAAYAATGDNEKAAEDYSRAIELDSTLSSAYLGRGIVYVALGQAEEAARDFWQWLSLNEQRTIERDDVTPGEPFTVQMQEGYLYRIPFEAEEGQMVTVTANDADDSGVDPLVVILDEDGNPLVGDDDSGGGYNSAIRDFVIPADGAYTLVVGHAGGGSVGAIEVVLDVSEPQHDVTDVECRGEHRAGLAGANRRFAPTEYVD